MSETILSGRALTLSRHRVRVIVNTETKTPTGATRNTKTYTGATLRCTVVPLVSSIESVMLSDRDRTKFRVYFRDKPALSAGVNYLVVDLPASMAGQMLRLTSEVTDTEGMGRAFSCLAEYRQEDQQSKPATSFRAARAGGRKRRAR